MQHLRVVSYRNKQFPYTIRGKGETILLIPPPGMGRTVFDKFSPLADNHQIIIPDFLGWEATVLSHDESLIQLYSNLLLKILEQEKVKRVVVFGYSAGAVIAQAFGLQNREMTKAIILAGGYPKVATKGLKKQYKIGLFFLKVRPESVIHFLGFAHARRKKFKQKLESKMSRIHKNGVYRFFAETYYFDCTKFLPYITIPVLTVYGKHEGWISDHRKYYDVMPHHKTVSIDKSLHQHPVRKPDALIHIIRDYLKNERIF